MWSSTNAFVAYFLLTISNKSAHKQVDSIRKPDFVLIADRMLGPISLNLDGHCPTGTSATGGVFDERTLPSKRPRKSETNSLKHIDHTTDHPLARFRTHYNDNSITKDDIFDYVYDTLHIPNFSNALSHKSR